MSFVDHLTKEHREIEKWITTLRDADDQNFSGEDLKDMLKQLHVHMRMEEEYLFPRLKKEISDKLEIELIEDSIKEHSEAKDIMLKLVGEDGLSREEQNELLGKLYEALEHHHKDEETKVFPTCCKALKDDCIDQITEEMEVFEKEHAGEFQEPEKVGEEAEKADKNEKKEKPDDEHEASRESDAASIGASPVKTDAADIGDKGGVPDAAKIGAGSSSK